MDEAEHLCDRVSILDNGRIIALDTPAGIVGQLGMETSIKFSLDNQPHPLPMGRRGKFPDETFNLALIGIIDGVQRVAQEGQDVVVYGHGSNLIGSVVSALELAHVPFRNLHTEQANLEDAFLALTGREIRS
jgi:ABC-2 type transport system ATP-binding protein